MHLLSRPTRRAVLAAGLVAAIAGCGRGTPLAPVEPALSGSFTSPARGGAEVFWKVLTPDGGSVDGLPLVVYLHGKGGNHTMVDYFAGGLRAHVEAGGTPLALACADAGDTYYHRRESGEDSGAMIVDELIPMLADRGLDTSRLGLAGISMGGYGSLLLAGRLGAETVRAAAVASPALWQNDSEYAPGAFDSTRDHVEHNVFGRQKQLAGIALRIDCGRSDPFIGATRAYLAEFDGSGVASPAHSFGAGEHDVDYWRTLVPDQLHLLAEALG